MARNRKRAKDRRARRPQPVATRRPARDEAPEPIAHAMPDVELAEAQLAVGRPEVVDAVEPEGGDEDELEPALGDGGGAGASDPRSSYDFGDGPPTGGPGELAIPAGGLPGRRAPIGNRLVGFLQGSWRELQRVQWPDRRQVVQATSVVIGFVIVAGVFLGLCDLAFNHLMDYVLYGK